MDARDTGGQGHWGYSGPTVAPEAVSANVARYWVHADPANELVDYRSEDDPVVIPVQDPWEILRPVRRFDLGRPARFRQSSTRHPGGLWFRHPQDGRHAIVPTGALPAPLQIQESWGIHARTVRVIPGAWDAGTEQ